MRGGGGGAFWVKKAEIAFENNRSFLSLDEGGDYLFHVPVKKGDAKGPRILVGTEKGDLVELSCDGAIVGGRNLGSPILNMGHVRDRGIIVGTEEWTVYLIGECSSP